MVSSLSNLLRILWMRRELIFELVRRELRDRHTGQMLGTLWAFGHPLLLMVIYTFLFAYVFPARYGWGETSKIDYSGNVLAGIVCWLAFQDLLTRAPSILIGHSNLVKQVVFPTEILPVKTSIASMLPYLIGILFATGHALWQDNLTWFALALPLLVLFQLAAMTGIAFLLSAAGVYLRDLRDVIQVFCTLNLFAQPILYNPFSTPDWLEIIFIINPFSYLVWCWQDVLYHGAPVHFVAWIFLPLGSVALLSFGWMAFNRMRHSFGDAL